MTPGHRRPARLALALALAVLVVSACGTTVRLKGSEAYDNADGLGEAPSTAGITGSSAVGGSSTTSVLGSSAPAVTGSGLASTGSGTLSGPVVTSPDVGGGIASKSIPPAGPIEVGIVTYGDEGALAAAGFDGAPNFSGEQIFQAIIKYINAHGGFGGHQADPIYDVFPLVSSTPYATEEQQACALFTQDHHVVAALSDRPSFDNVLTSCLATAHVPLITDVFGYLSQGLFAQYPLYSPSMPSGERASAAWVTGLQRQGYFTASARVGLAYCDRPTFTAVLPELESDLSAIGVHPAATSAIECADDSGISSQIAASVLKFKASGVDHVLLMDEAILALLWPIAADSQGYTPRFGLNSNNTPGFVSANVPPAEFHNAIGVGWWPWEDVADVSWPTPNATAALCLTAAVQAGLQVDSGGGRAVAMLECGMTSFLLFITRTTADLSAAGMAGAVNSFGSSFLSPNAFRTEFGPTRHDGAAAYRDFSYVDSCSCFEYSSPTLYPM